MIPIEDGRTPKKVEGTNRITDICINKYYIYHIRTNKRPAAYKKIRVLWWWLIAVFAQKCPKKPQKGDFWPKKVVAYWNFRVVVA